MVSAADPFRVTPDYVDFLVESPTGQEGFVQAVARGRLLESHRGRVPLDVDLAYRLSGPGL